MAAYRFTMFAAGLLGLGITAASAAPVTTYRGADVELLAAPVQYVEAARDLIASGGVIVRVVTPAAIAFICPSDAPACSTRARAGSELGSCFVYLSSRLEPWFAQAMTELHEVPHCVGWNGDHAGARNPDEAELAPFTNATAAAFLAPPVALTTAQIAYWCERGRNIVIAGGLDPANVAACR